MKSFRINGQTLSGFAANCAPLVLVAAIVTAASFNTASAQVAPSLGTAQNFAVLGGSTVTNTGPTVITGELGVSPGAAVTGFPPGTVSVGPIHEGDAAAMAAQADTVTAYNFLAAEACTTTYLVPTDIGGMTLAPGVYCFASSAAVTGQVTLDGGDNANSVWVFKIGSTLTTATNSSVVLTNGAQQCKVFWKVGSSATLGTGTAFIGNILALTSITLDTSATVLDGRALAINGAVTMDSNSVALSTCAQPGSHPPTCTLTGTVAGPPKQILFSVQDTGSGLSSIITTTSTNATTSIPPFAVGDTNAVVIKGIKVDQSKSSDVAFKVFDVAGDTTTCDPVDMTIADDGGRGAHTFTDIPQAEHFIELMDQHAGVEWVEVSVNGHIFLRKLDPVYTVALNVEKAMKEGAKNKIEVWAYGPKGGSVYVLIHD